MTTPAQTFADALQTLETDRDVEAFVSSVFTADVVLLRPETGQELTGTDGAQQYWQQYLAQFGQIRSEFSQVKGTDGLGVLEWTSSGTLAAGGDISYTGVSLLDLDGEGRVTRFATYFDTAKFITPAASA